MKEDGAAGQHGPIALGCAGGNPGPAISTISSC